MADAPNRYDDPYWTKIAAEAEAKQGLPSGVLQAIVMHGEKSNNDQVSSAGAKTPFQIIPSTRDAFLKKYGVDAYLSPENAATVAALHIKDSIDRGASVPRAIGEYNGGSNPARWDKTVSSYIGRVLNGMSGTRKEPRSTFQTVLQEQSQPVGQLAQIYDAYKSGKMGAQDAEQFEADVKAGTIMLPKGASLTETPKASGELPAPILSAYKEGRMAKEDMAELERDVKGGMWTLPPGEKLAVIDRVSQIPGMPAAGAPPPKPGIVDSVIGAGEAALSVGTALTGGAAGTVFGTLKGIIESVAGGKMGTAEGLKEIETAAAKGAQMLTYAPRTQAGQEQTAATAGVLQNVAPMAGLPGEAAAIVNAAKPVVAQGVAKVQQGTEAIKAQVIQRAAQDVTPGTGASAGAAAVDMATLRQAKANELPVPIELTAGQKTRAFDAQRFERETAKDPAVGEPIRQRFADQNRQLVQNMDAFIDATGGEAPDLRSIGLRVDQALRDRAARDKAKIRVLYRDAEKAGELEAPVKLESVVAHLVETAPEAEVANVLKAARAKAIQLGLAAEQGGTLVATEAPLKSVELFRRSINNATNAEPTNIRQASILKGLVDEATEGLGGQAYARARSARTRYAKDYENVSLVRNILGQKRGSADRAIALEDVLDRSVISPSASLDDVRQVRRLLQTEGDSGRQAWKDVQGGVLTHIKEQATKNVARNERGDPIVSAAQLDRVITALDKSGKLEFVFGKKGAEQLRTINDVAKDVLTAPPGSVNTSNTASVLLAAMDMAISGAAGVPAPVLSGIRMISKSVSNAKTRARVNMALGKTPLKSVPQPTRH